MALCAKGTHICIQSVTGTRSRTNDRRANSSNRHIFESNRVLLFLFCYSSLLVFIRSKCISSFTSDIDIVILCCNVGAFIIIIYLLDQTAGNFIWLKFSIDGCAWGLLVTRHHLIGIFWFCQKHHFFPLRWCLHMQTPASAFCIIFKTKIIFAMQFETTTTTKSELKWS